MPTIDLRKQLKHLYQPSAKKFSVVDVPPMNFLMIDGAGNPNISPDFQEALEALYGMSYTLKFGVKLGKYGKKKVDYSVMALDVYWRFCCASSTYFPVMGFPLRTGLCPSRRGIISMTLVCHLKLRSFAY